MRVAKNSVLTLVRGNRHELRKRGLTSADVLALESIAYLAERGRGRSVRAAAVGRSLGVTRQAAHLRVRRLEAAGAIFRVGGAILLNVRGLLKWAAAAVRGRLEAVRRCFDRKKACSVKHVLTHRVQDMEETIGAGLVDRFDAVEQLRATYIPVHLRVHKG